MARLATWLVAHGRLVVAAVLAVTLGFAVFAVRLEMDFHPGDLLPQGHPFIEVHNRFHENFGEANVLSVMIEARSGTIFTPEILNTIYRATEAVDRLPGVNHDQIDSLASRFTRVVQVQSGGRMTARSRHVGTGDDRRGGEADRAPGPGVGLHPRQPGVARRARGPHPRRLRRAPARCAAALRGGERDHPAAGRPAGRRLRGGPAAPERLDPRAPVAGAAGVRRRRGADLGPPLPLLPRLARRPAADDLRRPRRHLGLRPPAALRVRPESAHPGDPVPHHGARGEPLRADARPLLRGAGRRRPEGGGGAALVHAPRRADHRRHHDGRARRARHRHRRHPGAACPRGDGDVLAAVADRDGAAAEPDRVPPAPCAGGRGHPGAREPGCWRARRAGWPAR